MYTETSFEALYLEFFRTTLPLILADFTIISFGDDDLLLDGINRGDFCTLFLFLTYKLEFFSLL